MSIYCRGLKLDDRRALVWRDTGVLRILLGAVPSLVCGTNPSNQFHASFMARYILQKKRTAGLFSLNIS